MKITPAPSSARRHLCTVPCLGSLSLISKSLIVPAPTPDLFSSSSSAASRLLGGRCRRGRGKQTPSCARGVEAQVANPPGSYGDVVALAEIVRSGADVRRDGRMAELDQDDVFQRPAARLVEAVLQFAGRDRPSHCQPSATLSADHLRYREVVAEIVRFDGSDYPPGMSEEESEPALRALSNEAMVIERKVWATPAKTLADVLLRGEIALYNENSVMASLDEPEAYYDERSVAQLIKAVVDVLGGLHAR
jgi:hypothetical protein